MRPTSPDQEKPRTDAEANILARDAASILLFSAMVDDTPDAKDIRAKYGMSEDSCLVTVKLEVNGVEVPFRETLNNAWKRTTESLEEQTLRKAKELVGRAGLQAIQDVVERMQREFEGHEFELERVLKAHLADEPPFKRQAALRALETVRERARDALAHVGQANYQSRCEEAEGWVDDACNEARRIMEQL